MAVRPWSEVDWMRQGLTAAQARLRVQDAVGRLSAFSPKPVADTGEVLIRVPSGRNEDSMNSTLMASGLYQYATPDWRVFPLAKPNDPLFSSQWHHVTMKSEKAWNHHTGHTVKIAIVDTGVDLTHPDLAPNLLKGYNSVDKKAEVDGGQVMDINGHGTHCAGDAAAVSNNNRGVAGVGWNLKIIPIRTSNSPSGGAAVSDMMDGARWAVSQGAKVTSHSYSGVDDPQIQTTAQFVRTKGSLLFYAAGNDNRNLSGFDHADAIVVGASGPDDKKAGFSAYGKAIDVFAPGVGIVSTTLGGGYGGASGTSMACPVAAGAAGLIYSFNPKLTPAKVEQILSSTCVSMGSQDTYGWGRIDLERAMIATKASLSASQVLVPSTLKGADGAFVSGAIPDLAFQDTAFYVQQSGRVVSGESAGLEATFTVSQPSKVQNLIPIALANSSTTRFAPAAAIFLWNWTTGKYERIAEGPLSAFGSTTLTRTLSQQTSAKYLNASGQVRMLYRAYSADRRGTGLAERFSLLVNRLNLGVESSS